MHISKIHGKYPVAFKPNNVFLRTKKENSVLERQLLMVLFVLPAALYPDSREVTIDINMITEKPLQGSICSRIRQALDNITDSKFLVYQDETHYEFINVFEKAGRKGNKITAIITQSAIETIKTYLPMGFTKIPIGDTIKLTTAHQFVFLELFLKSKGCKSSTKITHIKKHAGLSEKSYKRWDNFDRRVANSSIEGLNEILGYDINYTIETNGGKTTAIAMHEGRKRTKIKTLGKSIAYAEDNSFNFALSCFNLLSPENQKKYYTGSELFKDEEYKTLHAVAAFQLKHNEILEKYKTTEEVLSSVNCGESITC